MARKAMVTRTILTTKVNVLCMDTQSCEACNVSVTLPKTYKDENKLFKAVQGEVNKGTIKAVEIVSQETVETLYGMNEQDFINGAKVLDPTTRREIETEETEDEE